MCMGGGARRAFQLGVWDVLVGVGMRREGNPLEVLLGVT